MSDANKIEEKIDPVISLLFNKTKDELHKLFLEVKKDESCTEESPMFFECSLEPNLLGRLSPLKIGGLKNRDVYLFEVIDKTLDKEADPIFAYALQDDDVLAVEYKNFSPIINKYWNVA